MIDVFLAFKKLQDCDHTNLPQAASVCLVGESWDELAGSKAAIQGTCPNAH